VIARGRSRWCGWWRSRPHLRTKARHPQRKDFLYRDAFDPLTDQELKDLDSSRPALWKPCLIPILRFVFENSSNLSKRASAILADQGNTLYLSAAVGWEIAIKVNAGKFSSAELIGDMAGFLEREAGWSCR